VNSTTSLSAAFHQRFSIAPALADDARRQVYLIRHEVYCRDLGWESTRASGLEHDHFDARSIHCLMTDRITGDPVGCVRLVLSFGPSELLPFETSCESVLDRSIIDPASLDRMKIGEVSRLAIMRNYRQRKGEATSAAAVHQEDFHDQGAQPRFPFIPVGLYLGAAAIARRIRRDYVFMLTEPRMAHHFGRMGLNSRTIGGSINHRGERIPSVFTADTFGKDMRPMIRPLFDDIEREVGQALGDLTPDEIIAGRIDQSQAAMVA